jgi:pyruvate/2-oxoglutarate dehydrogenase complex dihydrolipoamide dehydrogenase (E3) component
VGKWGGILTDQRQQTNLDNIYAAGDCCEVKNLVNNRFMFIPLATTASRAGWVAGENAAGGNATFRGVIRAIGVKVFDNEVVHVGISLEEARESGFDAVKEAIAGWNKVAIMPDSKKMTIVMIADRKSRRLLGANLYGEEGTALRAHALAVALQHHLTIDEIQQLDLMYTPPFAPLWDPILVAANATRKKL